MVLKAISALFELIVSIRNWGGGFACSFLFNYHSDHKSNHWALIGNSPGLDAPTVANPTFMKISDFPSMFHSVTWARHKTFFISDKNKAHLRLPKLQLMDKCVVRSLLTLARVDSYSMDVLSDARKQKREREREIIQALRDLTVLPKAWNSSLDRCKTNFKVISLH